MGQRISILVIEDDQVDQMTFERFVEREKLPYDYVVARSVAETKEALLTGGFDIMLSDYLLGDGTALDFFDEAGEIPIVVITDNGDEKIAVQAMLSGAYEYLIKDPQGNYLTALDVTIEKTLRRKRAEVKLKHYREHLEELVDERTKELQKTNQQLELEIAERKQAEEALEEKERYFRSLLYNIHEDIIVIDPEHRIVDLNNTALITTGFQREEVIGKHCFEVFHGHDVPCDQMREDCVLMRVLETGESAKCRHEHVQADGSTVHIDILLSPLKDTDGNVTHVIEAMRDITDFLDVQESLRESEERLNEAQRIAQIGSWELDLITNTLDWSDEVYRIFNLEPQQFGATYETFLDNIHPDDRSFVNKAYTDSVKNKMPYDIVHRLLLEDGTIKFVNEHSETFYDDTGKAVRSIGTVQDITEQVQAEEALQQYSRQMETLNTVTAALSRSLELDNVLELIIDQIGQVIPIDSGAIFLHEEGELRVVVDRGITPSVKRLVFNGESELFKEIQQTGGPLILNNAKDDSRFKNRGQSENIESWMGIQLITRDTLIGFLTLDSYQPDAYSSEQVDLAQSFASQAAQAIENARLYSESKRRLKRLQALRNIDIAIANSMDLRLALDVLLKQVINQLGVDAAAVLLYESNTQSLEFAAAQGFHTPALQYTSLRLGDGFAGRAMLERRIIHIPDLQWDQTDFHRSPNFKQECFVTYFGVPLVSKGEVKGVLEIFQRTSLNPNAEWLDFLEALAGQAAIAVDNATLFQNLERSNVELTLAYDTTLEGWSRALELRDLETEGHSRRVSAMTIELARALGMSKRELVHVRRGALLHDIGKMAIPDTILKKPGALSNQEWEIMRQHPVYAYELLSPISYLREAMDIPCSHHEKWDGTGYPQGLKGEQIPLAARIFAVVDVWDALNSDRPYRKAWSEEKVIEYIKEQSGKHFDPKVVQAFLTLVSNSDLQELVE